MSLVNRRSLAGFCAAGAIALVAGCGGGGDDASDGLSADDFRSQADAICQASNDEVEALDQPDDSSTNAEFVVFLRAGLEANDAQIAKLRALEPPADLATTTDEALDLLEQQQARIRAAADRVAGGEEFVTVFAQEEAAIQALNDQADAKATELGLTVCGADEDDADASATTSTGTTATAPDATGGALPPDIAAVQTALLGLTQSLQAGGSSLADLQEVVPEARADLAEFDEAVADLASGESADAGQEKVRTAMAAAGPKLSDVLSQLLDAFEDGNEAAAAALVPEFQQAFGEVQAALAG